MYHHGGEEAEPDGKGKGNEIVHARDREYVLELVSRCQGWPLDHNMLDGEKKHDSHER